jgi:hypothetical protein
MRKTNHVHLFAFRLCEKAVFLNLFVPALVAYNTPEYVSIHLVDIHGTTVMTFGVSTRIQVNSYMTTKARQGSQ